MPSLPSSRRPGPIAIVATCLLTACARGPRVAPGPTPDAAIPVPVGATAVVVDGATGATLSLEQLAGRLARADVVLLGELHDATAHHELRAALVLEQAPAAARRAGIQPASFVFEHFAAQPADAPLPRPAGAGADTAWLDATGFDREGWQWPLHASLVEAALATGRPMRGSHLPREALSGVVRRGAAAAPPALAAIVGHTPLDSVQRTIQEREIVDGHCGQLPAAMVPGMRAAQEVRDAAMAQALLAARADGPAWLLAGNGHVRRDVAVPRLLRALAPGAMTISVGFLEWRADGTRPAQPPAEFDLVVYTPPLTRPDPCAAFTRSAR
jgi:uncharacterized iron-regulated protein